MRIGDMIVPAFADRDAFEQVVATIERLPQLQKIGFALQFDAELTAHVTRAPVAAHKVLRAQFYR